MIGRRRTWKRASLTRGRAGFFIIASVLAGWISNGPSVAQNVPPAPIVRWRGNIAARTTDLLEAFGNPAEVLQDSGRISAGLGRILAWYRSEGYLRAAVDSTKMIDDAGGKVLSIHLTEGLPAVIRSVRLDGVQALNESFLRERMQCEPGSRFRIGDIERDIVTILHAYEESGYPVASVRVASVAIEPGAAAESTDVLLRVEEGPIARIDEIAVEGQRSTRKEVIVREARISPGEVYLPQLGERIRRRLGRMGLFTSVEEPEVFFASGNRAGLLLRVTEGAPNRFDGIVGYVPSPREGVPGYVTGLLHLQFRNLFGTGRQLAVRWFRENQNTQEAELRYREPWVLGVPLHLDLALFQRQQDSTYVRLQAGVNFEFSVGEEWWAGVSLDRVSVYPTDGYGKSVMPEGNMFNAGASIRYDSRDDAVTPTAGILYETAYRLGAKQTRSFTAGSSEQRFTTQDVSLAVSAFISPLRRHVLLAAAHFRDRTTPELDVSDLARLGGATTLRGYREGQFMGSRLVWGGIEYRFLAGQRSFLFGFVDAASFATPGGAAIGVPEAVETRTGFGGGIRVDSPLGLIGVSIAFGEGDTFSTAKLHIRLINEF